MPGAMLNVGAVKQGNHAAIFTAPNATTGRLAMTSPHEEKRSTGSFAELSEAECREFLEQHTAGRVGFMAGDGPQILPVTYQYRNGSVIFRTSPLGPLRLPAQRSRRLLRVARSVRIAAASAS
jgi:hypothetical protein